MTNENRVQKGVPTGGQFATREKADTGELNVDVTDRIFVVYYPSAPENEFPVRLRAVDVPGANGQYEVVDAEGEVLGSLRRYSGREQLGGRGGRMREFWATSCPAEPLWEYGHRRTPEEGLQYLMFSIDHTGGPRS